MKTRYYLFGEIAVRYYHECQEDDDISIWRILKNSIKAGDGKLMQYDPVNDDITEFINDIMGYEEFVELTKDTYNILNS